MRPIGYVLLAMLSAVPPATAQSGSPGALAGAWQMDTPDGTKTVIVRPDSTASFGEETVWWRLHGDLLYIALGDEWLGYTYKLAGERLTLSGGDLEEPITLRRIGPPTPLPNGIKPPPPPPFKPQTSGG